MPPTTTGPRRRGTAIVEHTWQGEYGLLIVADGPKGDTWLLPGGGAETSETRMAATLREVWEEISLVPFAALYLFSYNSMNDHKVFLVRATGTPTMRDSTVKAIGLIQPDLSIVQIGVRKRFPWPTSVSPSAKKIAQRFYELRNEQSAFFAAFDTYTLDPDDDEATFSTDDR